MVKNYNIINFNINKFLKKITIKKQYKKTLELKLQIIYNIKEQNYKITNHNIFFKNKKLFIYDNLIIYIINIFFSQSNTLINITNITGKLIFMYSAGNFKFKGKRKKSRVFVLKTMLNFLIVKLKFLRKKPIALHFKNIGFFKYWIIKKLKKKFFIKLIKNFSSFSHNGCRKKKIQRKKLKKI